MARTHILEQFEPVPVVAIGAFAGSNLRYFVDLTVPSTLAATATVNTLGCLALGVLVYEERFGGAISRSSRTLLATGFVASFTTYSTFVLDALTATPLVAIAYVIASYALGFAAVLLGRELARRVTRLALPVTEGSG